MSRNSSDEDDDGAGISAETKNTDMNSTTVDALQETIKKVESSLLPSIDSYCVIGTKKDDEKSRPPSALGLDFLHVKNTLLLSYLIELTVLLRDTVDPPPLCKIDSNSSRDGDEESKEQSIDDADHDDKDIVDSSTSTRAYRQQQKDKQRRRLLEMRTVLDKSRGLDKKLRYQIQKLLSSLTDSSAFATGGDNKDTGDDDDDDDDDDDNDEQQFGTKEDDPLRYRPDPKSMLDDGDEDEEESEDDDDEESEDDDLAAARATFSISKQGKSKKTNKLKGEDDDDDDDNDDDQNDDGKSGRKYVAPRLTAVPYAFDVADKQSEKEKRQRRKLRATELAQTLRQQYGDQPDTEDVFGGGNSEFYGKQRSASRALAQREAERIEFEESTMVRLTTSRKEKKEKKRVERMMEGGSNLGEIANLGNIVRETQAFGRTNSDDDQDGDREEALKTYMSGEQNNITNSADSRGRYANGKRQRDPTTENRRDGAGAAGRQLKMGKRPKAYNSLQAALYGSGGSGGKPAKTKKKSRRYD